MSDALMNDDATSGLGTRVADLRFAFDRSFAEPVASDETVKEDLLAIRLAGEAHAIRLSEISGLFVDKKITPVPGGAAALLGIVGFRGTIVPVFDLQFCLGYSRARRPRWLVVAAGQPVALAFEQFEGQRRISRDAILPRQSHAQGRTHLGGFAQTADFRGPIADLASVLEAIRA